MPLELAQSTNATPYKVQPFKHQLEGIEALIEHPSFALFDECGAGKSAQVVNAACHLAQAGKIYTVVVVCPASVRSVWCDAEMGEIAKHSWVPCWVGEFHRKIKMIWRHSCGIREDNPGLVWFVTNYEFLRNAQHLQSLIARIDSPTLLVLDESSYIKSRTSQQTKAVAKLREHCARCVLLNGTPIVNNPMDLWSQINVLDKHILGDSFKSFWQFRAEYCETVPMRFGAGPRFNKIVRYRRLDDLQKRIAPYCLRRLKKDCLDLPPKLYTTREVAFTPESWKRYQQLRKEAVIALGNGDLRLEPNAAVRIMRLAQLTSGFLSSTGTEDVVISVGHEEIDRFSVAVHDFSSEKLDWCVHYLTEECTASHVIVWCRWRRERERLVEALTQANAALYGKDLDSWQVYGGQSKSDRDLNIKNFCRVLNDGSLSVLIAQPHAGGFGLNLQVATEEWFLSNDWSLGVRLQAEDRAHRPGQKSNVLIGDVLATGPDGQMTIDHVIAKALREKKNLADMTCDGWRRALEQ
jgi:SNF2 family DNA or RNA helicase